MQIVIDIPEDIKATIDRYGTSEFVAEMLWEAVKNGVPLPKGHGRLIDAYDMKDIEFINKGDYNSTRTIREWIDSAPTVIEAADKEQE